MLLDRAKLPLVVAALALALAAAPQVGGQISKTSASVGVRVTDQQHEQPIEQVRVELLRFPEGILDVIFTDSTGTCLFNSVVPDSYTVRAIKPGYRSDEVHIDIRRGDTHRQVELQLKTDDSPRAAPASGRISTRAAGIPESALNEFRKGAELLGGRKEPKQSIHHFQKAIELFPSYREAYFLLGMAHLQMNSLDDAHKALSKAIELDPKFLEPYHPLSVVLMTMKRYDEAETLLLRAMDTDKENWQWPFELARCYASQGSWDKAMTYGQMAHQNPRSPTKVHLLMADLYSNTGNTAKAIEELEEFTKLDPESPHIARTREVLEKLRNQKPN